MTKKILPSKFKDQAKLNELTNIVLENIEDIYDYFDVPHHKGQKVFFSPCFIHGGDNKSALNLYYDADYRVHYKCRTHGCEKHFGTSLLSMIRGGLSRIKYNWSVPGDKTVNFDQTVEFLLKMFKVNFGDIKGEPLVLNTDNHEFCKVVKAVTDNKIKGNITREFYRGRVEIPSQYFLQRGYSIEVLDDYDVGTCKTYGKPFFNRAVVPVYDDEGQGIIGFTGRSIFEQCNKCKSYHDPKKDCYHFPKWRHTKGFQKEKCLYNYSKAKSHIQESGVIILVESPGNVWRLEEAGIHNSVALFGTSLNSPQRQLIDESGALTIILIMDNDENNAGQDAALVIKDTCEKAYRVYIIDISKNDVGEMSTNEVTTDIKPWIEQAKEVYAL
jgi:hypothetical protein